VAVEPLGKACGTKCDLLTEAGCSIHAMREKEPNYSQCIAFKCMWLEGWSDEEDRPDKTGVVFVRKDDPNSPGRPLIHALEARIGAATAPRTKFLIRQVHAQGIMVVIQNSQFAVAMEPNGDSWIYQIDAADPLRSRVDPKIPRVQITARGKPVVARPS
jgi:hypothetical protein